MKSNTFLHIYIFLVIMCGVLTSQGNPVIAIFANADPDNSQFDTVDKINVNYVRWLESAGAEVVIIHTWYDEAKVDDILSKANGALLQGGSRNLHLSKKWEITVKYIIDKVKTMNEKNNIHFPLWATCQGFELLHALVAKTTDVLTNFNAYNFASSLTFNEKEEKNSKMFSLFTPSEIKKLQTENITQQFHHLGVNLDAYDQRPDLNLFFLITSFGIDNDGKTYIATVESRNYPIYAVQFHPEKTPFDRNTKDNIPQSLDAVEISQRFAQFFVSEAKKNANNFTDEEKTNYDFINTFELGNKYYQDSYYIYQNAIPPTPVSPKPQHQQLKFLN